MGLGLFKVFRVVYGLFLRAFFGFFRGFEGSGFRRILVLLPEGMLEGICWGLGFGAWTFGFGV